MFVAVGVELEAFTLIEWLYPSEFSLVYGTAVTIIFRAWRPLWG